MSCWSFLSLHALSGFDANEDVTNASDTRRCGHWLTPGSFGHPKLVVGGPLNLATAIAGPSFTSDVLIRPPPPIPSQSAQCSANSSPGPWAAPRPTGTQPRPLGSSCCGE